MSPIILNTRELPRLKIYNHHVISPLPKAPFRNFSLVIIKGIKELKTDIRCVDYFSGRGQKPAEHHLPHLLEDIKAIVEPVSQVDPTFRTDQNYCPLTAGEVRLRLMEDNNYTHKELPEERTIRTKLNELGFKPQKVAKSKPLKKTNIQMISLIMYTLSIR